MDKRSSFQIRLDAIQRLAMSVALSKRLPLYLVNEYPKSGGSWVGQMLAELLGMPFPRNRRPALVPSILHCHYLQIPGLHNVVVVFRDGRDIMVSAYYHYLFPSNKNSPILVGRTRRALPFSDYDNIRENLPRFIQYMFDELPRHWSPFRFSWSQFCDAWHDTGVVAVRYEDLLSDAAGAMGRVVSELTGEVPSPSKLIEVVDKYSFANQTKRKPGQEDKTSFLRKGIAGDWKEKFSPAACEAFAERASAQLIALGYEEDDSWVASRSG